MVTTNDYSPWTEWSEYCRQEGFEPNEVQSDDPVVRLLAPLYQQIADLAAEEAQQAQRARQNGERYTLNWTQVFVNLQIRMALEKENSD